jgi:hypothetical protein
VRYNYNKQVSPPAPFVYVSISRPESSEIAITDLPAQLDSGADISVIPAGVVDRLNLVQLDYAPVAGFGGHMSLVPTYLVGLAIRSFGTMTLRVIADRDEPYVLLGRDVLNHFRVELDGPNLIVEIG